ncbi:hypothetical protein AAC387_Pa03g3150 [Persea americana]
MTGFHGFSFLLCCCCCCVFFFSTAFTNELESSLEMARTAGYGDEKLSSVLVTGTLLCEACLDGEAQSRAWHVPGASVVVTCKIGRKRGKMNWAVGTTDEYGDFIVDLPSHLHANPRLEKACMVRVLRLPKSSACWKVFPGKPKGIRLSSVGNGIRTYTTGTVRLQSKSKVWRICLKRARDLEEERSW